MFKQRLEEFKEQFIANKENYNFSDWTKCLFGQMLMSRGVNLQEMCINDYDKGEIKLLFEYKPEMKKTARYYGIPVGKFCSMMQGNWKDYTAGSIVAYSTALEVLEGLINDAS